MFSKASHWLTQKIFSDTTPFSTEEKDGFLRAQKLAIQCAKEVGAQLRPGVTEKETAKLMDAYLHDHGVHTFFHKSFAWFGDRTRFLNFKNYFNFLPSSRVLKEEDMIILDTAPIVESFTADIGYTFSLNPQDVRLKKARDFLKKLYDVLPMYFESSMKSREIWEKVNEEMKEAGYANIHSMYPFSVLGHRLRRHPLHQIPGLTIPFSIHAYTSILSHGLLPELLGPKHEGSKEGLWAIEPHLGGEGFGAKFEEILVVENGKSYWLDQKGSRLLS